MTDCAKNTCVLHTYCIVEMIMVNYVYNYRSNKKLSREVLTWWVVRSSINESELRRVREDRSEERERTSSHVAIMSYLVEVIC